MTTPMRNGSIRRCPSPWAAAGRWAWAPRAWPLLAAQDDARVEASLAAHAGVLGRYGGLDVPSLRTLIAQTRALGYARSGGCLNTNTAAVGHAVRDPGGCAFAAVSLSTTVARLTQREAARLASLLRAEIAQIEPRVHFAWSDEAALR